MYPRVLREFFSVHKSTQEYTIHSYVISSDFFFVNKSTQEYINSIFSLHFDNRYMYSAIKMLSEVPTSVLCKMDPIVLSKLPEMFTLH